ALPALAVFALALLAMLPAWWGWLSQPSARLLDNPFTGGHVWAADVVSDALWGGHWPDPTDQAGFPGVRSARYVGLSFLAAAALLRPLLTGNAVVHLAGWVGPALGGAGLVLLVRRLAPGGRPALQVAGGLLFALSPVTLGAALSGQVENTQTFVLTGLLLLTWHAVSSRAALAFVPLAWLAGALTSPYLALFAAFLAPWVAWRALREGASRLKAASSLVLAAVGLLVARAWLDVGSFLPESVLYRPSYSTGAWPPLWVRPLPVAGLDTLLFGVTEPQVKATVIHQPYLGLALLFGALLLGGRRRTFALPVALGVLLALGPRLAFGGAPVTVFGHELLLPALLVRWLHLPLAYGGQYYRAIVLAHLGLCAMIAAGTRPGRRVLAGALLLSLLGCADALRCVSSFGLPWPTVELPLKAWTELAQDPVPGGVLNLPMQSTQLRPNHPVRLAGHAFHRRALSDMPRAWTEPPADPLMARVWGASLVTPTTTLPALSELCERGFRFVVLDLPAIPERRSLLLRLQGAWGRADGADDGLLWWASAPGLTGCR
ncbi:MAG: hypothetical protein GXP62_15505, partial [Oligoflexia bacterium]|nr:hypothetical protein [Oligoflexia bacterium]